MIKIKKKIDLSYVHARRDYPAFGRYLEHVALRVSSLRARFKYTQKSLAAAIDVKTYVISDLETKQNMKPDLLWKLFKFFKEKHSKSRSDKNYVLSAFDLSENSALESSVLTEKIEALKAQAWRKG